MIYLKLILFSKFKIWINLLILSSQKKQFICKYFSWAKTNENINEIEAEVLKLRIEIVLWILFNPFDII
jgi:hypothetical protein